MNALVKTPGRPLAAKAVLEIPACGIEPAP